MRSHDLNIERGRLNNPISEVDDEIHIFLHCSAMNNEREILFHSVAAIINIQSTNEMFLQIMTSRDITVGAGALGWWLEPLPFTREFGVRFPVSAVWKKQKMFLPHPRVKISILGSLRDREVAYSASDRQCANFESCVWKTLSYQSSHHPQEVLLTQFSLYVHKGA